MRVRKCHTVRTNTKYHSDLRVNLQGLEIPNLSLLSVCPSQGNGPIQGQRKAVLGFEPTTYGIDPPTAQGQNGSDTEYFI